MATSNEPEIILTRDGSHSIRSKQYNVDYHSVHGAIQESLHVFIKNGLLPVLEAGPSRIKILEMGFGTGLNALLVMQLAQQHPEVQFEYRSLEEFPLEIEIASELNYPGQLGLPPEMMLALHRVEWGPKHQLMDNFSFRKHRIKFPEDTGAIIESAWANLIFYDAFAPASQPELWGKKAMAECNRMLEKGGNLVTYCAKGQFKRDLKASGFKVECPPGPPGKREMTRGIKV